MYSSSPYPTHSTVPMLVKKKGMGAIDWGSILTGAIQTGEKAISTIISRPQPGQYTQTGSFGTTSYQLPYGATQSPYGAAASLPVGGTGTMLIIGAVAVMIFLSTMKR